MTNTLNPDKLMEYSPRSNPERSIHIPPKYNHRAEKIVELALRSLDMNMLVEKVSLYPSLTGMYIPDKVLDLMVNKEGSLKAQDEVYLETCLHLITDELSTMDGDDKYGHEHRAHERYNAIRNHQNIKNFLRSL